MVINEMWRGGPKLYGGGAFKIGTDAVLLSAFPSMRGVRRVCDLGSGSGVISILLSWNNPQITVDGIELQPEAADISNKSAVLCGLDDRVRFICGDIRCHRDLLSAGAYDLVVSNPPYFPTGSGKSADDAVTATARDERSCTLGDVCQAAGYLTKYGGRFAMVHRPERLAEVIRAMSKTGLEPKRLRFVQYSASSAPSLFLIEGRRGGKPSMTVEAPLILTDENGGDSAEIRAIYHREEKK
ncbi:MAG: methyltransferase [Oscillospiraceae bacterium]|nr:methyltransferase [Oscillospiraceae bacterium]